MTVYSGVDSAGFLCFSMRKFHADEGHRYGFFLGSDENYYLFNEPFDPFYMAIPIPRKFDTCLRIVRYRDKVARGLKPLRR